MNEKCPYCGFEQEVSDIADWYWCDGCESEVVLDNGEET